jgi:hypothetical protein
MRKPAVVSASPMGPVTSSLIQLAFIKVKFFREFAIALSGFGLLVPVLLDIR